MVTGRKAFEGKSQASLIGAIMTAEPPAMSELQAMSPPSLDPIVKTCLAKDPDARWQSLGDVGRQLKIIASASGAETRTPFRAVPPATGWRPSISQAVAACLVVALLTGAAVWSVFRSNPSQDAVMRFSVPLGPGQSVTDVGRNLVVLTPDGMRLSYQADDQLFLRHLEQLQATPISGTVGGRNPFVSPGGEWIGFWSGGQLRKVAMGDVEARQLDGGPVPLEQDVLRAMFLGGAAHFAVASTGTLAYFRGTRHTTGLQPAIVAGLGRSAGTHHVNDF